MLNLLDSPAPLFHALGDPTRLGIIERLSHGPTPVSHLSRDLPISLPGVMQHLAVLENCGLVRSEKTGRVRTCMLNPDALKTVTGWCDMQRTRWEERLDALGRYLDENPEEPS